MTRRLRLTLGAWRRLQTRVDPNRTRLHLRARLGYSLAGVGHSLFLRLQEASREDALKSAAPSNPIFILGFWRSGTTLLHEILCCDSRFGFPSTYACMNPSHFLLTEQWASKHETQRRTTRPMDNMSYSWASPQEDEFALLALGAPSPYESLIVPSLMRDPRRLVDLRQSSSAEQKCWQESFLRFHRLLTVQQNKMMVLKSPPHGFKLPLLLSMFPEARYIVIERNPYEVFASNLKLWRTLLDLYALESFSSDEIERFVLAAYLVHEEAIDEGTGMAGARRVAFVRYESLVADPVGQAERLYDQLELGSFEGVREAIKRYAAGAAGYTRNRLMLSSEQKAHVEASWGGIIKAKNYCWPDQYLSLAS